MSGVRNKSNKNLHFSHGSNLQIVRIYSLLNCLILQWICKYYICIVVNICLFAQKKKVEYTQEIFAICVVQARKRAYVNIILLEHETRYHVSNMYIRRLMNRVMTLFIHFIQYNISCVILSPPLIKFGIAVLRWAINSSKKAYAEMICVFTLFLQE